MSELTDMGLWAKSLQICKYLQAHGSQSLRRIAQQTGLSKSSVHRVQQARARRESYPESGLWDTPAGRDWLLRLVIAVLYTFGLKRGVGVETLSAFLMQLRLETQVGCSPGALRPLLHALETAVLQTTASWEHEASRTGKVRAIIGGVDETFLEHLMLVFQDLPSGYLVVEEAAPDRTFATWKTLVENRLKALRTTVQYLVSDRAQALIQLAEQGLQCLSVPDFFHLVHDLGKSYALAIGQRVRQAHQELHQAQERLSALQERLHSETEALEAEARLTSHQAEGQRWQDVQGLYRRHMEALSLTLHPFGLADSRPQTSRQVAQDLRDTLAAIATLVQQQHLPQRQETMTKVRKQVPGLAALVDWWWQEVRQEVEKCALTPSWQHWVLECLLPVVYWTYHMDHTRCPRRKASLRQALERVGPAFHTHPLTQQMEPQTLAAWQAWAIQRTQAFQRTSSAVEGRNGIFSQLHHNQRGLPWRRYKVWTRLHTFDCRAADGTTPAARFFQRTFPDLFETVVTQIAELPQPRRRRLPGGLCTSNSAGVPL